MPDHHQPIYHFVPQKGWMNDPNGPLWYKGYYHLFFQHNPTGDTWGNLHWGHIRSKDLITWETLPLALVPSPELGETHCFSGCAVLDGKTPTILYTSVGEGNRNARTGAEQRLARSGDDLLVWKKHTTPILSGTMHNEPVLEWRDPFVWKENDHWQMLLGGSLKGYGCILLYQSADLLNWDFLSVLLESKDYPFLECPNLLRFGNRSVLFYSPNSDVRYHTGFIDNHNRFITEKSGVLDYSGRCGFYASNTLLNDPQGRYITWGWITEESRGNYPIQGYNGALSLPRIIGLNDNGDFVQTPAEEITPFLSASVEQVTLSLAGYEKALRTRSAQAEIRLTVFPGEHDDFSLNLYKSEDGRECTRIHYNHDSRELTLEKGMSSLHGSPSKDFQRAKLLTADKKLDLRIFLDHSIIEIFANNEAAITGRVYPVLTDSSGISLSGRAAQMDITIREVRV
jgi:beta-fructofuranosidase